MANKAFIFTEMKKRNFIKAEVFFSGGNDEGGCDDIFITSDAGVRFPVDAYSEDPLYASLSDLPHEKFYTFAGDFYVSGMICVDVLNETITLSGEESVNHQESIYEEF